MIGGMEPLRGALRTQEVREGYSGDFPDGRLIDDPRRSRWLFPRRRVVEAAFRSLLGTACVNYRMTTRAIQDVNDVARSHRYLMHPAVPVACCRRIA